jgi:glycosyltransferase involved in cell wall biosynthesis
MKILHAILSRGFYGSERYCIELATAQARGGHQVEVLVEDGGSDCARVFRHEIEAARADIAAEQTAGTIALVVIPKRMPAWLHRPFARRVLGRFGPDIVHSHLNPAARRVGRVAQTLGIAHVATLHIDYEAREHASCDGLIAIASWQRARIGAEFRGHAVVIWNWLPAAVGAALARTGRTDGMALRRLWHAGDDTIVFGSIGRLLPAKGMDVLVRAFRRSFPQGSEPVRLAVLGDGPQHSELAKLATDDARIVLVKPQPDIAPFYRALDIYVSAARFEPFGLTILEAMAAGLPLVLTRTQGPREFVKDAYVSWVTPEDETELAETLRTAYARGQQTVDYDLGRFKSARAVAEIEAFYRKVLARKGSKP